MKMGVDTQSRLQTDSMALLPVKFSYRTIPKTPSATNGKEDQTFVKDLGFYNKFNSI